MVIMKHINEKQSGIISVFMCQDRHYANLLTSPARSILSLKLACVCVIVSAPCLFSQKPLFCLAQKNYVHFMLQFEGASDEILTLVRDIGSSTFSNSEIRS